MSDIKKKRPPKLQPITAGSGLNGNQQQNQQQAAQINLNDAEQCAQNSFATKNDCETPKLDSFATLALDGLQTPIIVKPDELEVLQQLGSGQYGIVEKVRHRTSGYVMAVKRVTAIPTQDQEARRLLRDVDILVKGTKCKNIIKFYGALLWEGDLWILMELMDCSLDRFYKLAHAMNQQNVPAINIKSKNDPISKNNINSNSSLSFDVKNVKDKSLNNNAAKILSRMTDEKLNLNANEIDCDISRVNETLTGTTSKASQTATGPPIQIQDQQVKTPPSSSIKQLAIPDPIIGRIASDVIDALSYLYGIKVIHRDIKPSNILVSRKGQIKLCDFGISGYLVNSVAKTYEAGCRPYMAPERIDPPRNSAGYDIRSDVWSLGITLMELATGKYPYDGARDFFQQLKMICANEPPQLPANLHTKQFEQFLSLCLKRDAHERANYDTLAQHTFINEHKNLDVSEFVSHTIDTQQK